MLVRIGSRARVYPDATGLRPVFYSEAGGQLWVAAQPLLLARLLQRPPDHERISQFLRYPHGTSWPGLVTAYEGVSQLWPNHYLDLETGKAHRFWPLFPIERLDLEAGAERAVEYLSNILSGAARRSPLYLWLTGGYDSRVLFAASRALHSEMTFCVTKGFRSICYDTTISRALARKSGKGVRVIRPKRGTSAFWELLRTNTAGMSINPGNLMKTTLQRFPPEALHVTGSAGEVGRCFYYTDGKPPDIIDPETLCRVACFDGNPVALAVMSNWLEGIEEVVEADFGIHVLDLLYWEHRLGVWLADQCLGNDTFAEFLVPFNCRAVLIALLAVDREHRRKPYRLFRKMCELAYPEVLDEPFNWSRRWQIQAHLWSMLPWRLRGWTERLRAKLWGVNTNYKLEG